LTPLAAPRPVGSAGGTLTTGAISITIPAASVPDGTNFQLTQLSGQGLPGLLPLGWSPVAAFDLRTSALVSGLPAVVSQLSGVLSHLAIYDPALHAWTLIASNLPSINGSCSFTVPAPGAYALVVPDTTTPPIPVPDPGSPLTGIPVQAIDPAASSSGSLNPAMLPPAGGTATATLGVQSPSFTPSGTIIQANVLETFSLASGDKVSEETRSEDILLYNALAPANSTMGAKFPVTPSHQYTLTQLVTGKVHLDILAGREGVRGQPGGNDPLTLSDGTSTLSVPGGALSQDTAISVQSTSLEDFVPTSSNMAAIQEALVDFSGETLNTPAQLSIAATGLNPSDTFLLTQVQRINGVPYMVAVALARINGQNLSSITSPGFPGVTQGGEYVFYDILAPVGFVQGVTSSTASAVSALVLTDSLQIAGISGANGHYIVPALAGTANLKASAPNTSLAGTASAQVIAGQTVTANILLAGTVTRATVTPADGTLGVPTSTIITINTTAPLNPQSIVQSNLSLVKGPASAPGAPVPLQNFILSASGTTLTFAPVSNLDPATQYTIQVSGLADASGGAIAVPTSSFTTKAVAALNFDPNAITFAFPDQNGNIHVSAPAGSLPPGTKVLIIDQGNAVVVSFTAFNDGSVSGDFPGTINDVLQITVTDPNGAAISFTRSQFVAPDGSVAVRIRLHRARRQLRAMIEEASRA
ncbi:MAG TPA: Ig-like domain-containing protein, partial [Terriglobales bacterium]|nr:Ig-like domain-containing protein [Terriglobales bacterium]